MELVYLWVEDYKNIHKQGFNFSPRFECSYDEKTEELTINEKKDYVNIFPENINVTAIVGENGSGKSTLLELISFFRFERAKQILNNQKMFVIFQKDNTLYITSQKISGIHLFEQFTETTINNTSYYLNDRDINADDLFELTLFTNGLSNFTHQSQHHNFLQSNHYDSFYNGYNIHFSNTTDEFQLQLEFNEKYANLLKIDNNFFNIINESFLFDKMRIEIDFRKMTELTINDGKDYLINDNIKILFGTFSSNTYSLGERRERLNTDGSYKDEFIDIEKKYLIYRFLAYYFLQKYIDIISHFIGEFNDKFEQNYLDKVLENINLIIRSYFNNSKRNRKKTELIQRKYHEISTYLLIITTIKIKFTEIDQLLKKTPETEMGIVRDYELLKKEISYIRHFQKLFNLIYTNFNFDDYKSNPSLLVSELVNIDNNIIKKFYAKIDKNPALNDVFRNILININFYNSKSLNYNYLKLSTGEKQLLNFFVSFCYTISKMGYSDKSIILLDEIEIALHPQWQKTFFNTLIKFIKKLSDLKLIQSLNKFHFIIITHSPFLLSDLPKENVIFLENGKQVDVDMNPFGANIHTLLSHGFFMKGGLMGEFAKGKIEEIKRFYEFVKMIEERIQKYPKTKELVFKSFQKRKNRFENIHKIIGEPFLQTIIGNYLNEIEIILSNLDKETFIDNEIKRLQELKASFK